MLPLVIEQILKTKITNLFFKHLLLSMTSSILLFSLKILLIDALNKPLITNN